MRSIAFALLLLFAAVAHAESARVKKVLPHFLDAKGRTALNPSLFDRDAYQAKLRDTPALRHALRFDIDWTARGYDELTLRLEAKGGSPRKPQLITLTQQVRPGWFGRWTSFTIAGDDYAKLGDLLSWRVTLLNGTNEVAQQKSFLW